MKVDFDKAIVHTDDDLWGGAVKEWLDALDKGECWSLLKRFQGV